METSNTSERLASLRTLMKERSLDVYIVPSGDAHASEYCAPCDERRAFISGFTGSAGTAVISQTKAALATDGRYFTQAAKQLDSNWELLKQGQEDVLTWQDWATQAAEGGKTVGVDSTLISAAEAKKLHDTILKKSGGRLVGETENLIDLVWGQDRPSRPSEMVKALDVKFAGREFHGKIDALRKDLEKKKLRGFVVSMLDEIAWLFNLRGQDIPYNPVFFAYALITPTASTLYLDEVKIDDSVRTHLGDRVQIRPYQTIFNDLLNLSRSSEPRQPEGKSSLPQAKIGISNQGSWALGLALGGESKVEHLRSPIEDAKAIKNDVELEGMRQCHIRDGAALSEYFAWLEEELVVKKSKLDEVQAADKLESIRKQKDLFVGLSFDTISSTGPNAAVIHYKPTRGACEIIDPNKIYLCDSGAQYFDGTTDTTRTLHMGQPTAMEVEANTLVLKGMIALDTIIFPKGTHGLAIDIVARSALFSRGLNYMHGTGHGIGSFLNVHEGPIGVGMRAAYAEVALSAGNVISNEPGYYQDGDFGIRIENIIMCRETKTKYKFGDKPWLGFEHVTMVPLCRKLIDTSLLTKEEIAWVDNYHAEVMAKTGHLFEGDSEDQRRTMRYLQRECAPL